MRIGRSVRMAISAYLIGGLPAQVKAAFAHAVGNYLWSNIVRLGGYD
jgi:hypothetical protein